MPEGRGPLVVLLHGWPPSTPVLPDLRGYGFSDKPPSGYDTWLGH